MKGKSMGRIVTANRIHGFKQECTEKSDITLCLRLIEKRRVTKTASEITCPGCIAESEKSND